MRLYAYVSLCVFFSFGFIGCKLKTESNLKEGPSQESLDESTQTYNNMCKSKGVPLPDRPFHDSAFWAEKRSFSKAHKHFAAFNQTSVLFLTGKIASGSSGCAFVVANSKMYAQTAEFKAEQERYKANLKANIPNFKESEFVSSPPGELAASICWSADGDVCFWEDGNAPDDVLSPGTKYSVALSPTTSNPYSQQPVTLQACTRCHHGDNIFVGHGELGDPAIARFPRIKLKAALGPSHWQPSTEKNPAIQCAGECHTIPQPNSDYCRLARDMMHSGLMLGPKFGLGTAAKTSGSNASSDDIDPGECQAWVNFLKLCTDDTVRNFQAISPGEPPPDTLVKPFAIAENLGRCSSVIKP